MYQRKKNSINIKDFVIFAYYRDALYQVRSGG